MSLTENLIQVYDHKFSALFPGCRCVFTSSPDAHADLFFHQSGLSENLPVETMLSRWSFTKTSDANILKAWTLKLFLQPHLWQVECTTTARTGWQAKINMPRLACILSIIVKLDFQFHFNHVSISRMKNIKKINGEKHENKNKNFCKEFTRQAMMISLRFYAPLSAWTVICF